MHAVCSRGNIPYGMHKSVVVHRLGVLSSPIKQFSTESNIKAEVKFGAFLSSYGMIGTAERFCQLRVYFHSGYHLNAYMFSVRLMPQKLFSKFAATCIAVGKFKDLVVVL